MIALTNGEIRSAFADLATPQIADACLRLDLPVRMAPAGARAVTPEPRVCGRVLPCRHYGSVDVFLEAMDRAQPGDVLVIDNDGRSDEGCIGDLTVLEACAAGVAGLIVWGYHRDTKDLVEISLPVFSYGACASGPQRLDDRAPDALQSARFGSISVSGEDAVFADEDGILFVAMARLRDVLEAAAAIRATERRQADEVTRGVTLRDQLRFAEYVEKRRSDPSYSFRKHLRAVGGAIEE